MVPHLRTALSGPLPELEKLLLDATPTDVGEFLKRRAALFGQGREKVSEQPTERPRKALQRPVRCC